MIHLKYVVLHDIEDHLRLGWVVEPETSYCHHADYSVIMKWICQCPIREPESRQKQTLQPSIEMQTGGRS